VDEVKDNVFEDANIVAFLSMMGHEVIPFITNDDRREGEKARVAFDVKGDVKVDMERFYNDEQVGIRTYIKHLRDIRSSIFNMK
jgi:hypothetical protein